MFSYTREAAELMLMFFNVYNALNIFNFFLSCSNSHPCQTPIASVISSVAIFKDGALLFLLPLSSLNPWSDFFFHLKIFFLTGQIIFSLHCTRVSPPIFWLCANSMAIFQDDTCTVQKYTFLVSTFQAIRRWTHYFTRCLKQIICPNMAETWL